VTESDVAKKIKAKVKTFKLLKMAAYDIGITPQFLTQVKNGHKQPSTKVLAWAGIVKKTTTITTYEAIQ
jgi:hypothetical protein